MNGNYIDTIATMSGIVIIAAGFAASVIYCTSKRMDWKVVISVSIVIAVLIGVGFYGFGGSTAVKQGITKVLAPDPKQTLKNYCQYLKEGNYDSLYDLFATDSPLRESKTRAQANQDAQNAYQQVNGVNTCIVNDDIKENGDSATGTGTLINGKGEVLNWKVFLKKEGYEWKIVSWSSI